MFRPQMTKYPLIVISLAILVLQSNTEQTPNKCRSLDNSQEVGWWAVITQPGGNTFLYSDSTKQVELKGGGTTITGPFEVHQYAPQRIEQLFINHINIGIKNNEQAFKTDAEQTPKNVKLDDFSQRLEEERSGFKTLQIWTNDQPANDFPTRDIVPEKDKDFAWAHSKVR